MPREETADSDEVRLVRYTALGSLPVLALMSLSAHGELHEGGLSGHRSTANETAIYEGDLKTGGYFTTFGGPADLEASSASSFMVTSGTSSTDDWSSSRSLASGAEGIRASRTA